MKRIFIDENICQGTRECAAIAPDAVEFSSDGVATSTGGTLADDIADRLAATCPSMAITVEDA